MAFQYILMKYAYLVMVGFFSVLFVYNLFTQKSLAKQIGCAILLIIYGLSHLLAEPLAPVLLLAGLHDQIVELGFVIVGIAVLGRLAL